MVRRSLATVSVGGELVDKLSAIAAAGFDGIELFEPDLAASGLTPGEVTHRCADLGLAIELFQPVRDIDGHDEQQFIALLPGLKAKLQVAQVLGAPRVLACSSVRPDAHADAARDADQLRRIGDLAARHGVVIAYEALSWGRQVNRVGQAWQRVRAADHPAVTLAVDTFHLLARGDDADALAGIPGDRIGFLQIADAPRLDLDLLAWSRHHRCFPGDGDLDLVGPLNAVLQAGYRGPLSLEVFNDAHQDDPAEATATTAMRCLRRLEGQLGARPT